MSVRIRTRVHTVWENLVCIIEIRGSNRFWYWHVSHSKSEFDFITIVAITMITQHILLCSTISYTYLRDESIRWTRREISLISYIHRWLQFCIELELKSLFYFIYDSLRKIIIRLLDLTVAVLLSFWFIPLIRRKSMLLQQSYPPFWYNQRFKYCPLFSSSPLFPTISHLPNLLELATFSFHYFYHFTFFCSSYFNYLLSLLFIAPFPLQAVLLCPYGDPKCVYPFGADPVWKISANELLFFNSMKMKMLVFIYIYYRLIFVIVLLLLHILTPSSYVTFSLFSYFPFLLTSLGRSSLAFHRWFLESAWRVSTPSTSALISTFSANFFLWSSLLSASSVIWLS